MLYFQKAEGSRISFWSVNRSTFRRSTRPDYLTDLILELVFLLVKFCWNKIDQVSTGVRCALLVLSEREGLRLQSLAALQLSEEDLDWNDAYKHCTSTEAAQKQTLLHLIHDKALEVEAWSPGLLTSQKSFITT